jgi:ribosomal protein S18 acetylase RimI-like enzyme
MPLKRSDVGRRVVVRTTVGDETGPSGGPALTDTLGTLESWDDSTMGVRKADGTLVTIAHSDVVAAKPVPPRPDPRLRTSAETLERIASTGWLPQVTRPLGDWVLRAAGGFTGRANSVLVVGDPGRPLVEALDGVRSFYADQALPARAQVVVDSPWERSLVQHGWYDDRPLDGGVLVQVASVAAALRPGHLDDPEHDSVTISAAPTTQWIAKYGRGDETDESTLMALLTSGDAVGFARLGDPVTAIGRASTAGDWIGLFAVAVDPGRRRRGQGSAIVRALLAWAAEHGAVSAYLQVSGTNAAALSMYARFGFATHHRYRYLRAPD